MANFSLKDLSEKQRDAWKMRYRYGWRMTQIALVLGIKQPAVTRLLQRAHSSAGLPKVKYFNVKRTKPRRATARSLSGIINY